MIFWEGLPGARVPGLGLTTYENQNSNDHRNSYGNKIALEKTMKIMATVTQKSGYCNRNSNGNSYGNGNKDGNSNNSYK